MEQPMRSVVGISVLQAGEDVNLEVLPEVVRRVA
jgi:hypothetical protein